MKTFDPLTESTINDIINSVMGIAHAKVSNYCIEHKKNRMDVDLIEREILARIAYEVINQPGFIY